MSRISCARCLSHEVEYMSLTLPDEDVEDENFQAPAIMAESCASCQTYLKIIHTEREPFADPLADELASIQLDILMGEQQFFKHGLNMLLLLSQADSDDSNPEQVALVARMGVGWGKSDGRG